MSRRRENEALEVVMVVAGMIPLTLVSSILIFSAVALAIGTTAEELAKGAPLIALGVGANALVFTAVPMLLAYVKATGRRAHERLGLLPSSLVDHLIAAIGLLGLTSALDATVQLMGLADYGRLAEMRDAMMSVPLEDRWPLVFVLSVGAGIPEELFFRGYVLHRLAPYGKTVALSASSSVFGMFHVDPLHAPLAAAMGVFLGFVVLRTGSLYPAITAHAVNNAVAAMTSGLELDEFYLWPSLLIGIAAIAGAFAAIVRRHRDDERPIVW